MNEFVSHVFKSIDSHESSIRRLFKLTRKNAVAIAILSGVALYQSMKVSDLKFELDRLSKRVQDIEENPSIQNNYHEE